VQISILLGFCFFLYFLNLGQWDLWNPDEPRYAQVAKEMVEGGDWILMHSNGKIYPDKPPLFFWSIGLSSHLFNGFTSFSVRFPAAFFGTLTVLLTFLLGRNLYSTRTGFFSGFILATSFEFAYLSTRANIDTTLAFFTTASLFCFFQWYRHAAPHPSPLPTGEREEVRGDWFGQVKIRNLSIYGFYVSMALATLAKGPIGFILPLLISLAFLLIQRDWKELKGMKLWPGMLLLVLIILAWYLPALLKGGKAYLSATLLKHSVDRFAIGSSHVRPVYYYLYNFPIDFLPWIFFLPASIAYGYFAEAKKKGREFLFLIVWSGIIFLFFSLSKGKRGLYLLPFFPAVSVLIGKLWDDFILAAMGHFRREWISLPLYAFIALTLVSGAAIPWVISMKFHSYLPYALPVAFLMVGSSLALFVFYRSKNYGAILFLTIGMMAGGFFYTLRVIFPLVNPYKSARFISQEITFRIQPGENLGIYGDIGPGPYNFYTGIVPILELEGEGDLCHFLRSSERVFCLLRFRDFSKLETLGERPEFRLIARRKVGGDDIVLISNR
jgi:4-amino-4-deoxy-L-arabinose transferase-like glycosyltransferase